MASLTIGVIATVITVLALLCCGYATVGVVPASGTVRFPVAVDSATRRYVLTAAIGQGGGRLRLHRLRVAGAGNAVSAPSTVFSPRNPWSRLAASFLGSGTW